MATKRAVVKLDAKKAAKKYSVGMRLQKVQRNSRKEE